MKKSELKEMIKEELQKVTEGYHGGPTELMLDDSMFAPGEWNNVLVDLGFEADSNNVVFISVAGSKLG